MNKLMGWQPIETAPKDGSKIIGLSLYTGNGRKDWIASLATWDGVAWRREDAYGFLQLQWWIPVPELPQ